MTEFLSVDEVIDLHDAESDAPLLDRGKLEGAVGSAAQTFDGRYLYGSLVEQGAQLLVSICGAHAFLDGNKRTAWLACVTFLDINGVTLLDVTPSAVVRLMRQVATRDANRADVTLWLNQRT